MKEIVWLRLDRSRLGAGDARKAKFELSTTLLNARVEFESVFFAGGQISTSGEASWKIPLREKGLFKFEAHSGDGKSSDGLDVESQVEIQPKNSKRETKEIRWKRQGSLLVCSAGAEVAASGDAELPVLSAFQLPLALEHSWKNADVFGAQAVAGKKLYATQIERRGPSTFGLLTCELKASITRDQWGSLKWSPLKAVELDIDDRGTIIACRIRAPIVGAIELKKI